MQEKNNSTQSEKFEIIVVGGLECTKNMCVQSGIQSASSIYCTVLNAEKYIMYSMV